MAGKKNGKKKQGGVGFFFGNFLQIAKKKREEVVKGIKGSIWKNWAQLATL